MNKILIIYCDTDHDYHRMVSDHSHCSFGLGINDDLGSFTRGKRSLWAYFQHDTYLQFVGNIADAKVISIYNEYSGFDFMRYDRIPDQKVKTNH